MGILDFLSRSSEKRPRLNWTPLESLSQLDELQLQSSEKKVLIFKHSTRCGISRIVLKQFENAFHDDENAALYYLDLLNYRDISNEIADRFEVVHQSPQLLVIEKGSCTKTASHHQILSLV